MEKKTQDDIEFTELEIKDKMRNFIDGEGLKSYLKQFNTRFDDLPFKNQRQFLHLILKEVLYKGNGIKLSLRDIPKADLSLTSDIPLTGSCRISSFGPVGPKSRTA